MAFGHFVYRAIDLLSYVILPFSLALVMAAIRESARGTIRIQKVLAAHNERDRLIDLLAILEQKLKLSPRQPRRPPV